MRVENLGDKKQGTLQWNNGYKRPGTPAKNTINAIMQGEYERDKNLECLFNFIQPFFAGQPDLIHLHIFKEVQSTAFALVAAGVDAALLCNLPKECGNISYPRNCRRN